mmetsp:Transcript_14801/g.22423  ORF Transcript_14801/g.22423 Transcript_14801/m.22423 type:complete len:748 (-) Transcript_14801:128-2371(-)
MSLFLTPVSNSDDGVYMEGVLSKVSGIRHVIRERYFRLRLEKGVGRMEKFKDKADKAVKDTYEIHEDSEVHYSEKTGAYWFTIKTKKVTLKFGAHTMVERMHWIKAIEKIIAELKNAGIEQSEAEQVPEEAKQKIKNLKLEIDGLAQEMRGKRGIRKKTHYFEYQNVKNSFKGVAIVEWLLKNKLSTSTEHAIEVGHELLRLGKLARVDGCRGFVGEEELYIFSKADGASTTALLQDIDDLTERLQQLSLEIHQVENQSEEIYDSLRAQISLLKALLKAETDGMRQHIDWLSGIALSVSCGTFVMGLWGNFSQAPVIIRLFLMLLMLAVAFLGFLLVSSSQNPELVKKLKSTFKKYNKPVATVLKSENKTKNVTPPTVKRSTSLDIPRRSRRPSRSPVRTKSAATSPFISPRAREGSPRRSQSTRHSRTNSHRIARSPRSSDTIPHPLSNSSPLMPVDGQMETKMKPAAKTETKGSIDEDWKHSGRGIIFRHFTEESPKDCWSAPDASEFKVRGANYLVDGVKIKSKQSRFEIVCCELGSVGEKVDHIANLSHSAIHKLRKEVLQQKRRHPFPIDFIVIQFQLPGISFTMYMKARAGQDPNYEVCPGYIDLFKEFVDGPDDFRNTRFKIVPTVRVGNWMVRKMVGAKPALLGRKITCSYYRRKDYLEIDVDIASSYVAQKILGVVQGYCKTLQVDLGFLIEGREKKELPEVMIGAIRFHHVDLTKIPPLRLQSERKKLDAYDEKALS